MPFLRRGAGRCFFKMTKQLHAQGSLGRAAGGWESPRVSLQQVSRLPTHGRGGGGGGGTLAVSRFPLAQPGRPAGCREGMAGGRSPHCGAERAATRPLSPRPRRPLQKEPRGRAKKGQALRRWLRLARRERNSLRPAHTRPPPPPHPAQKRSGFCLRVGGKEDSVLATATLPSPPGSRRRRGGVRG